MFADFAVEDAEPFQMPAADTKQFFLNHPNTPHSALPLHPLKKFKFLYLFFNDIKKLLIKLSIKT
jgi:hypothetical protein